MSEKPEKPDSEPEKKSGGGMAGLLVVALASGASSFGTAYMLPASSVGAPAEHESDETPATQAEPLAKPDQTYVELPEVLVTIGSAPATRYLKMSISIVTEKGGKDAVKAAEPVLVDAFVNYLRSVELRDFEDPGFYSRMRQQLSRRSELVLGSAVSDGVLITEFLLR